VGNFSLNFIKDLSHIINKKNVRYFNMTKKPQDLTSLRELKGIKEWLEDNLLNEKQEKTLRRQLLAVQLVFPNIEKNQKDWEKFLALNKNKKANFLNAFVDQEAEKKLDLNPEKNLAIIKNTLRVYVWNLQGLLARIGYEANPKNLVKIDNNASVEPLEITREDVENLYKKLNAQYQLILKIHFLFGGLNPADIVELRLNDFKRTAVQEFYYIYKSRAKTEKKGGKIFNVCHIGLFEEIKAYFDLQNLKTGNQKTPNDPIFAIDERTISDEFRYVIKQNNLPEKTIPKYMRQLAGTILEETLPNRYRLIWTQHKEEIKTDPNYVKNTIPKLIEFYPKIAEALLLGNGYRHQLASKKDLQKEMESVKQKLKEYDNFRDQLADQLEELKELKEIKGAVQELGPVIEDLGGIEKFKEIMGILKLVDPKTLKDVLGIE